MTLRRARPYWDGKVGGVSIDYNDADNSDSPYLKVYHTTVEYTQAAV